MANIVYKGRVFTPFQYSQEADFERAVMQQAKDIFGAKTLYIDVKKRISEGEIVTIPDGYLLDFTFPSAPRLYIVENELVSHDPFKHIGQQLLKFAISYKGSGRKIKGFLLKEIMDRPDYRTFVEDNVKRTSYRNIDDMLEDIIFERPVAAVVIIDEITPDLENVLGQLSMPTDILEFQTFVSGDEQIHRFSPFQQDVKVIQEPGRQPINLEEIDTIVVPAKEEGFRETFLGQNCWYEIRISSSMLDRIKWIAGYQSAPVSAITHYAPVARIEKYKDTNKYILYFAEPAKEIGPIALPKGRKDLVIYSARYTTFAKLRKAKSLDEAF
ncbi:MAG: hypothetical protein ABR899_00595 [Candidatus Krumholzibacteriaceae bacterium]